MKDISTELNLDYQLDSLKKQRDDIAKLQENAVGASIEAPISGTITSVTVKAGDEAQPDTALVTMQPEGKGFTKMCIRDRCAGCEHFENNLTM